MASQLPLSLSQYLLGLLGVQVSVSYKNRIPDPDYPVIVVSNHRSFMDAPLLIHALQQPVRIACHHYMGQTPLLKDMVQLLGCFPLGSPSQRSKQFLTQAQSFLQRRQWVGLFPEGTSPMIQATQPNQITAFGRGFAHLAFRVNMPNLAVLPVCIASLSEKVHHTFPLKTLHFFDPSEPLFNQSGLQPIVTYQRTHVLIGHPYWITAEHYQHYQGKQAKTLVNELTQHCHTEISTLLAESV